MIAMLGNAYRSGGPDGRPYAAGPPLGAQRAAGDAHRRSAIAVVKALYEGSLSTVRDIC